MYENDIWYDKYLKYKTKYTTLKQLGGVITILELEKELHDLIKYIGSTEKEQVDTKLRHNIDLKILELARAKLDEKYGSAKNELKEFIENKETNAGVYKLEEEMKSLREKLKKLQKQVDEARNSIRVDIINKYQEIEKREPGINGYAPFRNHGLSWFPARGSHTPYGHDKGGDEEAKTTEKIKDKIGLIRKEGRWTDGSGNPTYWQYVKIT